MPEIDIEPKTPQPHYVDMKRMAQALNRVKDEIDDVEVRCKHRSFVLLISVFIAAVAYSIAFWNSFANYKKSCEMELEALEQQVVSLELALEKANSENDNALKEINDAISEISASIAHSSETDKESEIKFLVPPLDTSFKSYMDYRTITNTASQQYVLQQQAYTDELGLREIDGFYCIALGTYYSSQCGEKFKICTDSGNEFCVIVADIKDDRHTDESNMYVPLSNGSANVVEFIVDTSAMERRVQLLGDISGYEQFSGNIVKIERI